MNRATCDQVVTDDLAHALSQIREELSALRQLLDETLCELKWANRNADDRGGYTGSWRPVTSMPVDPAASDFAERLNRFSAADLPKPGQIAKATTAPRDQLF